ASRLPLHFFPPQVAVSQADCRSASAHRDEVHIQGTGSVQRPKRAQTITQSSKEYSEFRPVGHGTPTLQLGGCHEPYLHTGYRNRPWAEIVDRRFVRTVGDRGGPVVDVELVDPFHHGAAAARTESLGRHSCKYCAEGIEDGLVEVEHVQVE